jgi:hypothetical protein
MTTAVAVKIWQLGFLLLLVAGNMAAAADPQGDVNAANFKRCPRACRTQRMDAATYCRTCSACAGYKTRCAGEVCSVRFADAYKRQEASEYGEKLK